MRKVIKASEGHILTNGEVYGTKIYLTEGVNADDYHEITLEEYNNLMEAESEIESEEATEEDYQNALKRLGVDV